MKIYRIYHKTIGGLYAITDKKEYFEKFLSQRNSNLFTLEKFKIDKDRVEEYLTHNSKLRLIDIPLEDETGDYSLIGTVNEENILNLICERVGDFCYHLNLNFTQNFPFNSEYKTLIDDLTTISRDENYHQIIQLDSVKLFYFLFRNTFTLSEEPENLQLMRRALFEKIL